MKLPTAAELCILATMAVLCAAFLAAFDHAGALILVAFVILFTSMLMGAYRNGKLGASEAPAAAAEPAAE